MVQHYFISFFKVIATLILALHLVCEREPMRSETLGNRHAPKLHVNQKS